MVGGKVSGVPLVLTISIKRDFRCRVVDRSGCVRHRQFHLNRDRTPMGFIFPNSRIDRSSGLSAVHNPEIIVLRCCSVK